MRWREKFFGMMFMIMNEGRLTLEHLYALAPAFLQFFPPTPAFLPYPHTTTVQHCNYNAQVRIGRPTLGVVNF